MVLRISWKWCDRSAASIPASHPHLGTQAIGTQGVRLHSRPLQGFHGRKHKTISDRKVKPPLSTTTRQSAILRERYAEVLQEKHVSPCFAASNLLNRILERNNAPPPAISIRNCSLSICPSIPLVCLTFISCSEVISKGVVIKVRYSCPTFGEPDFFLSFVFKSVFLHILPVTNSHVKFLNLVWKMYLLSFSPFLSFPCMLFSFMSFRFRFLFMFMYSRHGSNRLGNGVRQRSPKEWLYNKGVINRVEYGLIFFLLYEIEMESYMSSFNSSMLFSLFGEYNHHVHCMKKPTHPNPWPLRLLSLQSQSLQLLACRWWRNETPFDWTIWRVVDHEKIDHLQTQAGHHIKCIIVIYYLVCCNAICCNMLSLNAVN